LAATLLAKKHDGYWGPYFAVLPRAEDVPVPSSWGKDARRGLSEDLRDEATRRAAECTAVAADLEAAGICSSFDDVKAALSACYSRPFTMPRRSPFWLQLAVLSLFLIAAPFVVGRELQLLTMLVVTPVLIALWVFLVAPPEETTVLMPVVDLVNHASSVPIQLEVNSWTDEWELRAGCAFAAGDEVLHSYSRDNDELLSRFGFVEVDNPYDAMRLPDGRRLLRWGQVEGSADELESEVLATARASLDELRQVNQQVANPHELELLATWQREKQRLLDETVASQRSEKMEIDA